MPSELFPPAGDRFTNRLDPRLRQFLAGLARDAADMPSPQGRPPLHTDPQEQAFWEITNDGDAPTVNEEGLAALQKTVLTVGDLELLAQLINQVRLKVSATEGNAELTEILAVITEDLTGVLMGADPPPATTDPPR